MILLEIMAHIEWIYETQNKHISPPRRANLKLILKNHFANPKSKITKDMAVKDGSGRFYLKLSGKSTITYIR